MSADVDDDPQDIEEWRDALLSVSQNSGAERARQIMDLLVGLAQKPAIDWQRTRRTPYVNTILVQSQPAFPGDLMLDERLVSIMRWNALAMVLQANKAYGELGGYISSYTSAADLFEVGFNHFFHARNTEQGGDLIFYQPHSAPGIYARAFLEGRLRREDFEHYRQEITADTAGTRGFPSYPHPWLMPAF
jgi:pyruvate dehydrogenase E1 component